MSKGGNALDSLTETLRMKVERSHEIQLKELEIEECKIALQEHQMQQMMQLMAASKQPTDAVRNHSINEAAGNVLYVNLDAASFDDVEN